MVALWWQVAHATFGSSWGSFVAWLARHWRSAPSQIVPFGGGPILQRAKKHVSRHCRICHGGLVVMPRWSSGDATDGTSGISDEQQQPNRQQQRREERRERERRAKDKDYAVEAALLLAVDPLHYEMAAWPKGGEWPYCLWARFTRIYIGLILFGA